MNGLYNFLLILVFSLAGLVFILLFYIPAPYGKFSRRGWGPTVKSKWAWMIMESPSPVLMTIFFLVYGQKNLIAVIFILTWLMHYLHRSLIYPFTQSGANKSYPVVILFMAFIFNCFNGFINGYGIFAIRTYGPDWSSSWQFIAGGILFLSGFLVNKTADAKLRMLRKANNEGYVVPKGWLFSYISCPHYFGEMIEWGGWAVMTWSLPGLAFFVFTFANLFPRALSSHKWYRQKFPDYPAGRKAVIPFLI